MGTSATSKRCWPTGAPVAQAVPAHQSRGAASRLQDRLDDPEKHWKFNPADLKERGKWDEYTRAYEAALGATSTDDAPWYVIPADHKWYRNRVISQLLLDTLSDMNPQFPEPEVDLTNVAVGAI